MNIKKARIIQRLAINFEIVLHNGCINILKWL